MSYTLFLLLMFSIPLMVMFALWTRIGIIASRKAAARITSSPVAERKAFRVQKEQLLSGEKACVGLDRLQTDAAFAAPAVSSGNSRALLSFQMQQMESKTGQKNGATKETAQKNMQQEANKNGEQCENRMASKPGNSRTEHEHGKRTENRALITVAFIIGYDHGISIFYIISIL